MTNICLLFFSVIYLTLSLPVAALTITTPSTKVFDNSLSWANMSNIWYFSTEPLVGELTTRSIVATADGVRWDDFDAVQLAGFSTDQHATPSVLSLKWRQEEGTLFPQWRLYLEGDGGLLLGGSRKLLDVTPVNGHQYETLLSYDPNTGVASYRVTDLTTALLIHAGGLQVKPYFGLLFGTCSYQVIAASDLPASPATSLLSASIALYPLFLPVGTTWDIVSQEPSNNEPLLTTRRLDRNQKAFVEINKPVPDNTKGVYRILYQTTDGQTNSLLVPGTIGKSTVELPTNDLRFGASSITMQYLKNNQVVMTDSLQLTMGKLSLQIATSKKNGQSMNGQVVLHSDQAIPANATLTLGATLSQLTWDLTSKSYKSKFYQEFSIYQGDIVPERPLDYSFSAPAEAGYWQITLHPVLDIPGIIAPPLDTTNTDQTFTTYVPASVHSGDLYSMVIFGDTQLATYYNANRGYILDRQALWVAENAQAKNTVLALQVGDLTELNQPIEWERAQHSFGFLDGVVPYVLALGNHDSVLDSYEKASRNATRMNQYFTASQFSHLGDTFAAGHIENSYSLFDICQDKYLVISVEYAPRNEVLAWVNSIIDAYPDRRVILVTHHFLSRSGLPVAPGISSDLPQSSLIARNPGETMNDGQDIWLKVGRLHKNMFMIISGHVPAPTIPFNVSQGVAGNLVYQLLVDFQGEPNGGNGWLVLLNFTSQGTIEVNTYSPYLSQYKDARDEFGYGNRFIINVPND